MRELCIQNNYEFISNMQINNRDLWRDGIHLPESGKILIAKYFTNSVNNFLSKVQVSRCAAFCLNVEDKQRDLAIILF